MIRMMRPLVQIAPETRRAIRGVFTDIDDTLSTHGHLHSGAFAALERLRAAGKMVIPISGRPAGLDRLPTRCPATCPSGSVAAARYTQSSPAQRRRWETEFPRSCSSGTIGFTAHF